jgi:O-methyltransferase
MYMKHCNLGGRHFIRYGFGSVLSETPGKSRHPKDNGVCNGSRQENPCSNRSNGQIPNLSERTRAGRKGPAVARRGHRYQECGRDRHVHRLLRPLVLSCSAKERRPFDSLRDRSAKGGGGAQHFEEAGVEKVVTIIEGDARKEIAKLKLPIDIVFIDADKSGYVDDLNKLLPLVRPRGLLLADNVDTVPEYVKAVQADTDLETIFYREGGGLAVTLKR